MVPLLKYTVLRLALFVAALAALAWFGAGPLVAVIGAGVVSMLVSYLLLRGPREDLSRQVSEVIDRRLSRNGHVPSADTAAEDAADDAQRAAKTDPDQRS